MISFFVKGSSEGMIRVLERTRYFALAESLGGVEPDRPFLDNEPRVDFRDVPARWRNYPAIRPTLGWIEDALET